MHTIKIITSTTREGRKGDIIANWMFELTRQTNLFKTEMLDLTTINLPLMDEPHHPRLQQYTHEHTKKWSEQIQSADGFIIILGEYNFGFPAPIKNALDYLFNEWKYKPVGLVSYGGVSGGLRASQMLKLVLTALSMMPIPAQVNIPFFAKFINDEDVFMPDETITKSAHGMLHELKRWADALKAMR